MNFQTFTQKVPYQDALKLFKKIKTDKPAVIFESSSISEKFGRLSLIGINPILELKGLKELCEIHLLDTRGTDFFEFVKNKFEKFIQKQTTDNLEIFIPHTPFNDSEEERINRQNTAQVIKHLLNSYKTNERNFFGLYGALSYNFIYQFEDVSSNKSNECLDFHLFLFDTIFLFNHLTQEAVLYCIRTSKKSAEKDMVEILQNVEVADFSLNEELPEISNISISPDEETFKKQVEFAKELFLNGELMEIVLSRKIKADFIGNPLNIYDSYKKINPSPYLFYFDLGDEYLLGASPEMMVRYENGRVQTRPISGSITRGANTIDDHRLMMELLNSPKEKSELDMLIDLARNDLARVCKPPIQIEHYRNVEKYSHVMHTAAQVSGELMDGKTGFDALIACLNAGTLTGAPKLAAMKYIEEIEKHSRGYYGGAIGYFLFNSEVNTAITIRSAHIKDNKIKFLSGATLLYESDKERELNEVKIKSAAFLEAIKNFTKKHETV